MADSYVEKGYNDPGYVEGDNEEIKFSEGQVTLRHFVSSGAKKKYDLISSIQSTLADYGELAVVYIPKEKTAMLVSKTGFMDFLSTPDINIKATVVAKDGTVLATPKVTSTDKYKLTFEINEALAGGSYFVNLDISTCGECRQG